MRALLIDADRNISRSNGHIRSKLPNLALMQLSTWLKQNGRETALNIEDPDEVWVSCVFKENADQARGIRLYYPDAEFHLGGSGVNWNWLPEEAQKAKPDYDLYPKMGYSMGFTTRGCIRKCPFCIVPEKEGKHQIWQHPKEFYRGSGTIMLLDNSWTANHDWFMETSQWLIDNGVQTRVPQGVDVRIMNPEAARQLKKIKKRGVIHLAWDVMKDEDQVYRGMMAMKDAGIRLKEWVSVYVLVGYNTTVEEDKYRCRRIKEWGSTAFAMPYISTKWTRRLVKWCRPEIFWSCDINEYRPGIGEDAHRPSLSPPLNTPKGMVEHDG